MKECPNCGKPVRKGKTGIYFHNETIKVNPVSAYQCPSCGEEYIDEAEYERLQNKVNYLKYAIPELENLIECPYCKEYNPPDKKFCIHCQKEIVGEELDGRKER